MNINTVEEVMKSYYKYSMNSQLSLEYNVQFVKGSFSFKLFLDVLQLTH